MPGFDDGDVILVPIRWCALQETLAVTNPGQFGETNTDDVLWRRHERATDNMYLPQAGITFRSAMTSAVKLNANFPIIPDPRPPSMGGPGMAGHILNALVDDSEILEAHADCLKAWDKLETKLMTNLEGPIVVDIVAFVEGNGSFSNLLGIGYKGIVYSPGKDATDACTDPLSGIAENDSDVAFAGVVQFIDVNIDPHDKLLAHEMGHVLFLGHGNGLDDDNDVVFDTFCDGNESLQTPASLMSANSMNNEVITPAQRAMLRAVAKATSGAAIDPPAKLIDGDVLRDSRVDAVRDVDARSVDILTAGIAGNERAGVTSFVHTLFGRIPIEEHARYVLFADLDADPETGGRPSDLGFATAFRGAELVTQVIVRAEFIPGVPPRRELTPTVWKFQAGTFMQVMDDRIQARLIEAIESETGVNSFHAISIQVPFELAPTSVGTVLIQALAEQLDRGGVVDRLPDAPEEGLPLFLEFPLYPLATITPLRVRPGGMLAIDATGLVPGEMAKVFLGDELLAGGPIDGDGNFRLEARVPDRTAAGPRLVTVGVRGTALTADTFIEVLPEAGRQLPGDCNQDGALDISDATCVFGVLFLGQPVDFPCGDGLPSDGANIALLDWQPDGGIDLSDGIAALQFLFSGGPEHPLGRGCVELSGCPPGRGCR